VAAKHLAAASRATEGLVAVLNVLNVFGSLVLPCALVLWNKVGGRLLQPQGSSSKQE
jgi:hypothetical protein